MAFTSADLEAVENAIRSLIADPTKSYSAPDGRTWTGRDLGELRSLRSEIQSELLMSGAVAPTRTLCVQGQVYPG